MTTLYLWPMGDKWGIKDTQTNKQYLHRSLPAVLSERIALLTIVPIGCMTSMVLAMRRRNA